VESSEKPEHQTVNHISTGAITRPGRDGTLIISSF
jgi:hypothetical protein